MDKLELKDLAPYLPYGLRIKEPNAEFEMTGSFLDEWFNYGDPMKGKPILRPMSDLTKVIGHCGETFIPIVRLLEMKERNVFSKDQFLKDCSSNIPVNVIDYHTKKYSNGHIEHKVRYVVETSNIGSLIYSLTYCENFDRFSLRDETHSRPLGVGHQLQLFGKLSEWHMDYNNLIEKGLAIDINTLKENKKDD